MAQGDLKLYMGIKDRFSEINKAVRETYTQIQALFKEIGAMEPKAKNFEVSLRVKKIPDRGFICEEIFEIIPVYKEEDKKAWLFEDRFIAALQNKEIKELLNEISKEVKRANEQIKLLFREIRGIEAKAKDFRISLWVNQGNDYGALPFRCVFDVCPWFDDGETLTMLTEDGFLGALQKKEEGRSEIQQPPLAPA